MPLSLFSPVFPPSLSPVSPSLFPSLPRSASICLFLWVSADLSTCQRFLKTGPCAFLALSPFLSFFTPLSLLSAADTQTHTRTFPHIQPHTHTQASTNSFSHTPSQVHPPAVSLSHALITIHTHTHTVPKAHSYTRAGVQMF